MNTCSTCVIKGQALFLEPIVVVSDHCVVTETWLLGPHTGVLSGLTQGAIIRGLTHAVVSRGVGRRIHTVSIVLARGGNTRC